MKKLMCLVLLGVFLLAACSNNNSTSEKKAADNEKQTETAKSDEKVTINTTKPSLKEAENIPAAEKKALLAVANQYIQAFNNKNLDAYMATISKNPTSFKYEEEKAYTKKVFDTMDVKMEPTKMAVIGYKTDNANVYMELKTTVKEKGSTVVKTSRQINTYHKENEKWKLISILAMATTK